MPDVKQLPHLISLLDDASLRDTILRQLAAFGPSLEDELRRAGLRLTAEQARFIRPLLDVMYSAWIKAHWQTWRAHPSDNAQLEAALDLIVLFQFGRLSPKRLSQSLDDLADEFDARYTDRDPLSLAEFLFQGYALRGVAQEDYYNPLNSNLLYVIEHRLGIPISLACVYILVGDRLGLRIAGCNFPGHFLAIASTRREQVIIDCFNGGTRIGQNSLAAIGAQISEENILQLKCGANVIVPRVLRNLSNAYEQANEHENAATMAELLIQTEQSSEHSRPRN
ncbi:MAG: hypothetical protein HY961_00735 [Ignavibacteriae bacterium]|nr:hypothetical protein [Ignavibacteriota bacterium]